MRLTVIAFCLVALPALAHKPSYSEGQYSGPGSAFLIEDPEVSIALYHPVTCEQPLLWMRYTLDEPADLFVQLGVPVIDRLGEYRPTLALLTTDGDPDADVPLPLPEGLGATVFDTAGVTDPAEFYEPFTQTESWILHESTVPVPAGEGYLVAYHPGNQTGKLWVAVGTREEFGQEDWGNFSYWLEETQRFHEVEDYEPDTEPQETVCEDELDLSREVGAGCGGGGAAWLLLAPALAWRRREGAGV